MTMMTGHRSRRGARGPRRLFWRVYLHGLGLLVLVLAALLILGALIGRGPPWHRTLERFAPTFGALCQKEVLSAAPRATLVAPVSCYRFDGALQHTLIQPAIPPLPAAEMAALRRDPRPTVGYHPPRLAVPFRREGRLAGYAVIEVGDASQSHHARLVAALAVVLVVLAIGSVPLVRAIVAPVERITATAQAIGAGRLDSRTGVVRRDELGQLARAFDEMLDRIDQLLRSEKELLANVSHELRTPLSRIRVALELAEETEGDAARRSLSEIATDLAELERLVDDLLTTTRLDLASAVAQGGAPPLRRHRTDPAELARQAAARFASLEPDRPLDVTADDALPAIEVDAMLVRRVLENLLHNARQHSGSDDPIALSVHRDGDRVTFAVTDQGQGVAPEDLPRLFEPFFRADRSRSRDAGGVGIGLTLCRRIVEAHGGQITAESLVGMGTTVRFSLPVS